MLNSFPKKKKTTKNLVIIETNENYFKGSLNQILQLFYFEKIIII